MRTQRHFLDIVWCAANAGASPDDCEVTRLKKAILTLIAVIIAMLAIFWGCMYVLFGHFWSGMIPLTYATITFASIVHFFRTRQFRFFRSSQLLLILLLPFLLQWSLGGFVGGSVVMIWAFFAPLAALLFADLDHAMGWLVVFVLLTVISGLLDPVMAAHARMLPQPAIRTFFVLNMVAGLVSIFFVFRTFVKAREHAHHLADEARRALELANGDLRESREIIRQLMLTDALTGIANRRHLDERLAEEMARLQRQQRPFSMLIADLDHFKEVNDRYGHEAGDEALKIVANTIRQHIRASDFVARYGGEEFVVLMPETDHQDAVILAERLRQAVSGQRIEAIGECITISLGVTTTLAAIPVKSFVRQADDALYQAKRTERDRVAASVCPPPD